MSDTSHLLKRPAQDEGEIAKRRKLTVDNDKGAVRNKKKMHAVLMMYCGWGYFGMQRTPTHPTIEGELSKALVACGYLDDYSGEAYRKIWFQRASKTDKSVSALGQVCSMMLPETEDVTSALNASLPKQLRILDVIRATRNFSAQTACSHRVYDYMFPTFALAPRNFTTDDLVYKSYRVSAERLTHANVVLGRYKGTHNFYNFTSGRPPTDRSCYRYIISVECLPPFLYEECEYAIIRVVGQSFMLHQIRKMIGLMIAVVRGNTSDSVFDTVFGTERMDIPKAPGLGLMLKEVDYTRYNERFGKDGVHKPILWSNYEEQMNEFKMKYIYQHIHEKEIEDRSMIEWLSSLDVHSYGYRESSSPTPLRNSATATVAHAPPGDCVQSVNVHTSSSLPVS